MREPDIYALVRFANPEEGGRDTAIVGDHYGCVFAVNESGFECRLVLREGMMPLGVEQPVPIIFMNPDTVLRKIRVGDRFHLWEGKNIAAGIVEQVRTLPSGSKDET